MDDENKEGTSNIAQVSEKKLANWPDWTLRKLCLVGLIWSRGGLCKRKWMTCVIAQLENGSCQGHGQTRAHVCFSVSAFECMLMRVYMCIHTPILTSLDVTLWRLGHPN